MEKESNIKESKVYECDYCQKKFRQSCLLSLHIKNVHEGIKSIEEPRRNSAGVNLPPPPNAAPPNLPDSVKIESSTTDIDSSNKPTKKKKKFGMKKKKSDISKLT